MNNARITPAGATVATPATNPPDSRPDLPEVGMRAASSGAPSERQPTPYVSPPLAQVFLPLAAGYFLSYLFRNINATIFRDLVADLGLQASALGLLTGAYLFVFAAAQMPVGLLLDRYGPRAVNAGLFLVAGLGALGFALGQTVTQLLLARALIGFGVAAGLMAAMQSFTLWFPISRLATLNGFLMALGGLGAMAATAPAEAVLRLTDWRGLFFGLAALSVLVSAAVWVFVPRREVEAANQVSVGRLLAGLWSVLSNAGFWRITALACTTLGPAIALQGLWIGPWMRDVLGLDRTDAAQAMFGLTVALTIGFLLWGKLADSLAARGIPMILTYTAACATSGLMLAMLAAGVTHGAIVLWAVYILTITSAVLGYPLLAQRFSPALTGRVNASLNMSTFVAAFIAQTAIGPVLDHYALPGGGYEARGYTTAFTVVVICQALAVLILLPAVRAEWRVRRVAAARG